MKYKVNLYHINKIKNFFTSQKVFYFVFFNSKKQKTNTKLNQILFKKNFKLIKFKNMYLKNLFNYSILSNITFLCDSFIYFGIANNPKFLFKNFQKLKFISIFVENSIYNIKQLVNFSSLNYELNFKSFYFFLIQFFYSIRLK